MNTEQGSKQVAQPAQEEIKKHGDQLQKPVDEAAGKQPQERQDRQEQRSPGG